MTDFLEEDQRYDSSSLAITRVADSMSSRRNRQRRLRLCKIRWARKNFISLYIYIRVYIYIYIYIYMYICIYLIDLNWKGNTAIWISKTTLPVAVVVAVVVATTLYTERERGYTKLRSYHVSFACHHISPWPFKPDFIIFFNN